MSDWKQNPFFRFFGMLINHYLRVVDFQISQKVDYFVTNSQETAARIHKFYRREATVIYPPVDVPSQLEKSHSPQKQSGIGNLETGYFLYVNRLAFAKHPELAVKVCTANNWPLQVVGDGKLRSALEAQAGETVQFRGAVSDAQLHELYAGALALLYPVEDEDFGIVPIEAMGHGVPVVAHNSGGPRETIKDGVTGVLFDQLSEEGLQEASKKCINQAFSPEKIHQHAVQFAKGHFQKSITQFVAKVVPRKNSYGSGRTPTRT